VISPFVPYAGVVDVPEYGVRGKRGDFEPLISADPFYRVQSVLSGRVPTTTPQQRAHPDFPLRAFVRCESCGRGLTGTWSKGQWNRSAKMPLREGAPGAGLQIALEIESSSLVRKFDADVELPWAVARRVGAAAGVVVGEARGDIRGEADVVAPWEWHSSVRRRVACLQASPREGNVGADMLDHRTRRNDEYAPHRRQSLRSE